MRIQEDTKIKWKEFLKQNKSFPHPKAGSFDIEIFNVLKTSGKNKQLVLLGKSIQIGELIITPSLDADVVLLEDFNYGIKIIDTSKNNMVIYIYYAS